jgi:hypothetical protein
VSKRVFNVLEIKSLCRGIFSEHFEQVKESLLVKSDVIKSKAQVCRIFLRVKKLKICPQVKRLSGTFTGPNGLKQVKIERYSLKFLSSFTQHSHCSKSENTIFGTSYKKFLQGIHKKWKFSQNLEVPSGISLQTAQKRPRIF